MTDIKDPEPPTRLRSIGDALGMRHPLVARALQPIRRVTGRDLDIIPPRQAIALRDAPEFDLEPKTRVDAIRWSAIIVVLLPMLCAGVYLFFFASNQYVAEARFAVRQAEGISGGSDLSKSDNKGGAAINVSSILSGTSNLGGEDAEIVASYIHSRAVIDDVARTVDLRAIYRRPEADFWARLPNGASAEDVTKYWNKMVSVYIEASSGIVTLSVSAFRPDDALVLAKAILASSETLVNRLSLKIRFDEIKTAEDEVRRSEGEVRFALADLTAFRNAQHIIDPVQETKSTSQLLLDLMSQKIQIEGQLFVTQRVQAADAPGTGGMRAKLESVNDQIAQLKDQMAGDKQTSTNMAATISRFESLELNQQFAERMYGFARAGVERARIASIQQQIYLAVFVPPDLPQDFTYPLRWADFILISVGFLMAWISGMTIAASIIDHRL